MSILVQRVSNADLTKMFHLYKEVYGDDYPLDIVKDVETIRSGIENKNNYWWLAKDTQKDRIVGAALFEVEPMYRISRLSGLIVHPAYRGQHIATDLVRVGTNHLLSDDSVINSLYSTARTKTFSPQHILSKCGFKVLGIFPNAHRIKEYETLTLMVKFKGDIIQKREPIEIVPRQLAPLLGLLKESVGFEGAARLIHARSFPKKTDLICDITYDPNWVQEKFLETFKDDYHRFYPFHKPNLLLSALNERLDIFISLNKRDGYCTIVSLTEPFHVLGGRMDRLLSQLKAYGVSYIEVLIGVNYTASIEALLDAKFLPSAIYPAMLEIDGKYNDFVLMSYFMNPPQFEKVSALPTFRPFLNQYVDLWKQIHTVV